MTALNKTNKLIKDIKDKIAWGVYAENEQIPSVRQMAKSVGVSPYTVTQAYDYLVATGYLTARRGAGYFVRSASTHASNQRSANDTGVNPRKIEQHVLDTSWLMGHLFHEVPIDRSPGSGLFPRDWLLDANIIGRCSRQVIRQIGGFIYGYGHLQGYVGLRRQFSRQLANDNIMATPEHMVTTAGVSHAMELILRSICQQGDTILVDDPCWYWIIGCAQQMGLNVVGMPRSAAGTDLQYLEHCLNEYQPKLYITNSRLHNPTGFSYSAKHIYQVLSLLQSHSEKSMCYLVEDDVFGHLCGIETSTDTALRFAALDEFQHVIYVNGVSKSLGGNWRVGVMVCPEAILEAILRQKMLSNTACSELNERIIDRLWEDASYPKHLRSMRSNLEQAYHRLFDWLIELGFVDDVITRLQPSLFVWLDIGVDSASLALEAHKADWHIASGHLFSANGNFTTYIRLNVATTTKEFLIWLRSYILSSG